MPGNRGFLLIFKIGRKKVAKRRRYGLYHNAYKKQRKKIDSGIIKVLDMPGSKNIFASAVDTLTDLNYSQIIAAGIPVNSNSFLEIDEMVNHCVSVLEIIGPLVYKTTSFARSAWSRRSEIPEEMKETIDGKPACLMFDYSEAPCFSGDEQIIDNRIMFGLPSQLLKNYRIVICDGIKSKREWLELSSEVDIICLVVNATMAMNQMETDVSNMITELDEAAQRTIYNALGLGDDSTVKFMSTLCQSAFYSDKIMLGSITKQIQKETRNMLLLSIPLFFVNPLVSVGNLFIANAYGKNKINNQLNDAKQDMIKQIEVYCNHNVEKNL